jgi:hypothetical protein
MLRVCHGEILELGDKRSNLKPHQLIGSTERKRTEPFVIGSHGGLTFFQLTELTEPSSARYGSIGPECSQL